MAEIEQAKTVGTEFLRGFTDGLNDRKGNRHLRQALRRIADQTSKWHELMEEIKREENAHISAHPVDNQSVKVSKLS